MTSFNREYAATTGSLARSEWSGWWTSTGRRMAPASGPLACQSVVCYALLVPRRVKRRSGFTRLSAKRQITLPLAVVERAGIRIGEELAVEVDADGRVIVSRSGAETVGDRRRRALDRVAGALPGVWPVGALDELRDEWR